MASVSILAVWSREQSLTMKYVSSLEGYRRWKTVSCSAGAIMSLRQRWTSSLSQKAGVSGLRIGRSL